MSAPLGIIWTTTDCKNIGVTGKNDDFEFFWKGLDSDNNTFGDLTTSTFQIVISNILGVITTIDVIPTFTGIHTEIKALIPKEISAQITRTTELHLLGTENGSTRSYFEGCLSLRDCC